MIWVQARLCPGSGSVLAGLDMNLSLMGANGSMFSAQNSNVPDPASGLLCNRAGSVLDRKLTWTLQLQMQLGLDIGESSPNPADYIPSLH